VAQGAIMRSWGGLSRTPRAVRKPAGASTVDLTDGPWLACGHGRSYGDSGLPSTDAGLIDMRGMASVLDFDAERGVVRAQAGAGLAAILAHIEPSGWFLPVLPGTRHVTLGGALANDIHGKNHHGQGAFGRHVRGFRLHRSNGETPWCSPQENTDFFRATIGGMGLTGVVTEIELSLMRVSSPDIVQTALPLSSLADFFRLAPERERRHAYVVAWIDSLATGAALGRGVLLCGDHAPAGAALPRRERRLAVPFTPPFSLIAPPTLKAFNAAYRWNATRKPAPTRVARDSFFFPLDAVDRWNRLYGPRGLRQHQSVIPLARAEATVGDLLERAQRAGHGSFLTVLKLFGDLPSPGMLSFPMPGATLTLDFPYRGEATDRLLDELTACVLTAGGRINAYKDARITRETLEASFPALPGFRRMMDPAMRSGLAERIGL
jgi:FAD/FMN-containing dehydrogenase